MQWRCHWVKEQHFEDQERSEAELGVCMRQDPQTTTNVIKDYWEDAGGQLGILQII